MIAFKTILCPVDFSETSARALAYASAIATWYEARLTVLHVALEFNAPPAAEVATREPLPGSRGDVVVRLRRLIEQAGSTAVDLQLLAEAGRAPDVIVNSAAVLKADLLVMGTHGLSGFNRLLLGSVTEKVARTTSCPLLTVPPGAPASTPSRILFKKIVCPIDYSPASLKALDYALELGRQADGRVMVLNAIEYMDADDQLEPSVFDPCREPVLESRRRRQQFIDQGLARLRAQLAAEPRTWCEIDAAVAVNRAYKEILLRAGEWPADLIVMGAQGSSGLELMLYGSNTHHVVRAAPCPVLTVRG